MSKGMETTESPGTRTKKDEILSFNVVSCQETEDVALFGDELCASRL